MNILYAVSEAYPFAKRGGLGEVAVGFPVALKKLGVDIRVILPKYDVIPQPFLDKMTLVTNFTLHLGLENLYCGLYQLELGGITCYFVENDVYFHRGRLYGCGDDDARFAFFSKAVCESIRYMDWHPDLIHCNDWQTALIPFYLKDAQIHDPKMRKIPTMLTIHNVEFQGDFDYRTLTDVFGLPGAIFVEGTLDLGGKVNLLKGAIELSDCLTTVSPSYAAELKAPDAVGPIASVLATHEIHGIRNGIPDRAHPFRSRYIHRPYDLDSVEERVFNKLWMQEQHNLKVSEDAPVFGCVSRLLPRKGFELIRQVMPEFLAEGAQLVMTGSGDRQIVAMLLELKEQFPHQVALSSFSDARAVEIYSSADLFLMPSQEEPCGTAQMQAMRYGAVPVVRLTGGLRDTVMPYDGNDGWGFGFEEYDPEALANAIRQALPLYYDTEVWEVLQKRCMAQDFTWEPAAKEYVALYQETIGA